MVHVGWHTHASGPHDFDHSGDLSTLQIETLNCHFFNVVDVGIKTYCVPLHQTPA